MELDVHQRELVLKIAVVLLLHAEALQNVELTARPVWGVQIQVLHSEVVFQLMHVQRVNNDAPSDLLAVDVQKYLVVVDQQVEAVDLVERIEPQPYLRKELQNFCIARLAIVGYNYYHHIV